MIARLKKRRRKDKTTIQGLSEAIREQNFLLQHNDQYMLDLENQLEAVAKVFLLSVTARYTAVTVATARVW
jgi:uncharacterized coiled-coil protein SlyX